MPGYFVRTMLGMVSAAALFCGAGVARAQEQPRPPETQAEEGAPLTLEVIYTGDVIGGASGGLERGVRYLDNLFITADGDLGRLAGWDGAVFQVDVLNNLGGRPNDLAGSLQGVDNIEVPQPRLKLYEAWIEQRFGDAGSLRVGLYDLNSEFYVNESAALLISPSFGIGSELAATGTNGPSIFPSTALAARLRWNFDDLYAQAVVINAKAGTLGYAGGIDLSGREGVLFVGEGGWAEGNGKIAAGAWQYSKKQPEVVPPGLTETGRDVPSRGIYAVLEHDLLGTPGGPGNMTGFLRIGFSDGKTTPFSAGWQAGVLVTHVLESRPASAFSLGAASAILSDHYRVGAPSLLDAETVIEATYSDEIVPGVAIQPDVQYIVNTGADRSIEDALVLGLRLIVAWSSH